MQERREYSATDEDVTELGRAGGTESLTVSLGALTIIRFAAYLLNTGKKPDACYRYRIPCDSHRELEFQLA